MLRTTLVNCDLETGVVSTEVGKHPLGDLAPFALIVLLEKFAAIDPVQNAIVDPEVIIETTRRKCTVRTGQGRLFLYDVRHALEPAIVLSAEEVVAELDGSAVRVRSRSPIFRAVAPESELVAPQPVVVPVASLHPALRLVCLSIALGLTVYVANPPLAAESPEALPDFVAMASGKPTEALRAEMAGVYLTGSLSGHHGIALHADGTMKLFQLNFPGNPSYFSDTYRLGHVNGQVCVIGRTPNRLIRQVAKGTLYYGGEFYQRLP